MKNEVRARIKALNYSGTDEEQYNALHSVLRLGIKAADLRETVIERLTTEDMEELIQVEHCAPEPEPKQLTLNQQTDLVRDIRDCLQQLDDGLISFEEWQQISLLALAKQFK